MLGNDKKQETREGERHSEILKQRNDSYLPSPCITHKPTACNPWGRTSGQGRDKTLGWAGSGGGEWSVEKRFWKLTHRRSALSPSFFFTPPPRTTVPFISVGFPHVQVSNIPISLLFLILFSFLPPPRRRHPHRIPQQGRRKKKKPSVVDRRRGLKMRLGRPSLPRYSRD